MVFWFFSRGVRLEAFEKFKKSLQKNLTSSFSNIKLDIHQTERTLNELFSRQTKLSRTLQAMKNSWRPDLFQLKEEIIVDVLEAMDMESKMKELRSELKKELDEWFVRLANEQSEARKQRSEAESAERQVFVERSSVRHQRSSSVRQPKNDELSDLHIEILKRIMLIQKSLQLRCIAMKDLANELYPDRNYRRVKSTLSEYLSELHEAGLVDKRYQRRNRLFVSYTEKALEYAENSMIAKMRSLISSKR